MRTTERSGRRATIGRILDEQPWAHASGRFRALGWDFGVRTNDAAVGEHLDSLLAGFAADGEPGHRYSLLVGTTPVGWVRHRLYRDEIRIVDTPVASRALAYLLWDVNQQVFARTDDHLLVHAGVVAHGEQAVVLPGPSGTGKTTLTIGLAERGFGYASDEAMALDVGTLTIDPYPKPPSVKVGAHALLDHLRPRVDEALEPYVDGTWHLPPLLLAGGAAPAGLQPGWIIVSTYEPGAATEIAPASRAATLGYLMENGLNLRPHGRQGFELLAELVRRSRCVRLVAGDLQSACDAVSEAVGNG